MIAGRAHALRAAHYNRLVRAFCGPLVGGALLALSLWLLS
jgi:hypothetical protein